MANIIGPKSFMDMTPSYFSNPLCSFARFSHRDFHAPTRDGFRRGVTRVCLVHDLNLSGCNKGEKALFIPKNQEYEHQSIKFIALNYDIKKPVIHINGAVTCTYSGSELFVDLEKEREEQTDEMNELEKQARYKPQYEKAAKKPLIWSMKEQEGVRFYYRIDKKTKTSRHHWEENQPG